LKSGKLLLVKSWKSSGTGKAMPRHFNHKIECRGFAFPAALIVFPQKLQKQAIPGAISLLVLFKWRIAQTSNEWI
jgi:hypothetical protein